MDGETAIFVNIFKETFKVMESKQREISKHSGGFFSRKMVFWKATMKADKSV